MFILNMSRFSVFLTIVECEGAPGGGGKLPKGKVPGEKSMCLLLYCLFEKNM